ncbi:MAG TPA: hypothetical protein VKX49_07845 [Bryobacteraceae bacterium]|nr:hypothetical protein [Bryobacteraceae bacterium]
MNAPADLVTVYRSMDSDAEEASAAIRDLLVSRGIAAEVADDSAPGVPEGAFEVRTPSADSERAEQLIAENFSDASKGDASAALNLETVFHSEGGTSSEFEAMSVKNLLEYNGVNAVLVGDSVLPNLAFEVKVPHHQLQLARELIAQAEQSGAEEAEENE